MKQFIRSLAYMFTCKRIHEQRLDPIRICVNKQDVSCFNLSTNRIMTVQWKGTQYYFRACPKLADKAEYFRNAVHDFWLSLEHPVVEMESFQQEIPIVLDFPDETVLAFRSYIQQRLEDTRFISRLAQVDVLSEQCGFSIWNKKTYDQHFLACFGLENVPRGTFDIAVYFLWCMRSAAIGYRTIRICHGKKYSHFHAVRAIASGIVAQELDLSHLIADVRFCVLQIENEKEYFGVLSDPAKGMRMKDSRIHPTGSLQRELMNLNVLDVISYQPDHGPNNYTVYKDNAQYSVCAFDNDNPHTFFPLPAVDRPFAGCASLIDKNGRIHRPYFDKELAERICNSDIISLKKRLKPYLNFLQIAALIRRWKKLKKAILKTQTERNTFLISPADWNMQTVEQETNGRYGITYLTKALLDQ